MVTDCIHTHTHTHTQQAKEIVSEQRKRQSSELQHNTKENRTQLETKKMEKEMNFHKKI